MWEVWRPIAIWAIEGGREAGFGRPEEEEAEAEGRAARMGERWWVVRVRCCGVRVRVEELEVVCGRRRGEIGPGRASPSSGVEYIPFCC